MEIIQRLISLKNRYHPPFSTSHLPDIDPLIREEWPHLLAIGEEIIFQPGQYLFYAGHPALGLFLLKKGKIACLNAKKQTGKTCLPEKKFPLGLKSFLTHSKNINSALALEQSVISFVHKNEFLLFLEKIYHQKTNSIESKDARQFSIHKSLGKFINHHHPQLTFQSQHYLQIFAYFKRESATFFSMIGDVYRNTAPRFSVYFNLIAEGDHLFAKQADILAKNYYHDKPLKPHQLESAFSPVIDFSFSILNLNETLRAALQFKKNCFHCFSELKKSVLITQSEFFQEMIVLENCHIQMLHQSIEDFKHSSPRLESQRKTCGPCMKLLQQIHDSQQLRH